MLCEIALYALANYRQAGAFFGPGEFKRSLTELAGKEFDLPDDALLRAAARAPLFRIQPVKDVTFNKSTFLPVVLEEANAVPLVPSHAQPATAPSPELTPASRRPA